MKIYIDGPTWSHERQLPELTIMGIYRHVIRVSHGDVPYASSRVLADYRNRTKAEIINMQIFRPLVLPDYYVSLRWAFEHRWLRRKDRF